MAIKYKENPVFDAFKTSTQSLTETLPESMKPGSMVDLSKYANLAKTASAPQVDTSNNSNLLGRLKGLGSLTTDYGGSTKFEQFHPALDIANKIGTRIPSVSSGVIEEVVTGKKQGDPGYGNYIVIKDKNGQTVRYSHLNNAYVKVGQQVGMGDELGEIGNSGSTYSTSGGTGAHLDLRIKDAYNRYVNPYKYLASNQ